MSAVVLKKVLKVILKMKEEALVRDRHMYIVVFYSGPHPRQ